MIRVEPMKDEIVSLVRLLADHPAEVEVTELTGAQTAIFELSCHAEDVGKIIGKNGRTIAALRTLAGAVAQKDGKRAVVEVIQ